MTMVGLELGAKRERDVLGTGEQVMTERIQGNYKNMIPEKEFNNDNFIKERFFKDGQFSANDNLLLKTYLENISTLANQSYDLKKRAELTLFINCYAEYLTTVVPPNLSSEEAHAYDRKLLLKANETFIEKRLDVELNKLEPGEEENSIEMHLLAKRLLAIAVSDEFKQSENYQAMIILSTPFEIRMQQKEEEQKIKLQDYLTNLEHDLKRQMPYYQQAFEHEETSNARMIAVRDLFHIIDGIKAEITEGAITSKEAINDIVNPLIATIIQPETAKLSISERERLSQNPATNLRQKEPESTPRIRHP